MNNKYGVSIFVMTLALLVACSDGGSSDGTIAGGDQTGTGGSTARMTIAGDYLYAISGSDIQLFDIRSPSSPNIWNQVRVSWDIETLFPYTDNSGNDYLLIGAAEGLHILDNTDPGAPEYIVDFPHARTQDPVVAENDIAYVTLRSNGSSSTDSGINQLNVIDIANITNPLLIDTIPMQGPGGLSVDKDLLFVCDDVAGIKIFDTQDSNNLKVEDFIPNIVCNDVIAKDSTLFVITNNRVLQYDYSTLPARLISQIDNS